MGYEKNEFTLLSNDEVFGNDVVDVIEKFGKKAAISDYAIVLGADNSTESYTSDDDGAGKLCNRTDMWYTRSSDGDNDVRMVDFDGDNTYAHTYYRYGGIRPVFRSPSLIASTPGVVNSLGVKEIEYGEYPQEVVDKYVASELENAFLTNTIHTTGKQYTIDENEPDSDAKNFKPLALSEYEYEDCKYVRVDFRDSCDSKLSNGQTISPGDVVWIKVQPIKWLVSPSKKYLISKTSLISGIRYDSEDSYADRFKNTDIYSYLNQYFAKEIAPSNVIIYGEEEKEEMKIGSYGFVRKKVSEEDIVRGAIESGVAVFLHGASSEGKSARVMQIDPNCEIIYLRNATPESLNGKSVYNQKTGEMMDVPPTWLKKLEKRCADEPDKLHVVFFDEITNALPSIQGIAFNIVLNREVNGVWRLPENARIVAAGNDMKDSLAANQLAEPLFNRFAHVYIRTTPKAWLKWAREHNIHPAIYSFISYYKGNALRSDYDGVKPNADPRKWEMASKMLYKTGSPEMLRALIGNELTKKFVDFCQKPVLLLEEALDGKYNQKFIDSLDNPSKYNTTVLLSEVDEANVEKVRDIVKGFGKEFIAVFDSLWACEDEHRLEKIAELRLADQASIGRNKR